MLLEEGAVKGPWRLRLGRYFITATKWEAINDWELVLDLRLLKVWRRP